MCYIVGAIPHRGNSCSAVNSSTDPVHFLKEEIPVGERKSNDIPACRSFNGESLSAEISKLVMRLVRRYDQDEREVDGAGHWNSMGPTLRNAFQTS